MVTFNAEAICGRYAKAQACHRQASHGYVLLGPVCLLSR